MGDPQRCICPMAYGRRVNQPDCPIDGKYYWQSRVDLMKREGRTLFEIVLTLAAEGMRRD